GAFGFPLLVAVVVSNIRAIESCLEIGLGMSAAKEMAAWANFADGVQGLAVLGQINTLGEGLHHAELIGIHDELLVAGGETAFEPARAMQHEIGASLQ